MKNKYFLIKAAGILFLLLVVVIYFAIYFMPTIKDISKYRRDLKDMNLKITDFVKMENTFTFPNNQEREYFKKLEQELNQKIPTVRTREDFIALFTRVSDYIRGLARKDGIFNLVITSDSSDLKINAGSLSTDKKSLDNLLTFSTRRLSILRKEMELDEQRMQSFSDKPQARVTGGLETFLSGVKYHTVYLSFTGELKPALDFINHLPWSNYYLTQDRIMVSIGDILPYYLVQLKIYYSEYRSAADTGGKQ